jgi:molybdopterin-guanine dinucleotide biosynthesis protein A
MEGAEGCETVRSLATIAILAGGKSSRFGGIDKQEAPIGGESLGRRAAKNALSSGCSVLVVGRNPVPYADLPVEMTEDVIPGFGPLSGLHAALLCARTEWVYLMACDMPFFSADWLDAALSRADGEALAVVARRGDFIEPFHALYSRKLAGVIETILAGNSSDPGCCSLVRLVRRTRHIEVPEADVRAFSPDWRLFSSINRFEDLISLQVLE